MVEYEQKQKQPSVWFDIIVFKLNVMVKVNTFIAFPHRVKLDSQNNCLYSDLFVIVTSLGARK
jgi:hypothetical protein